MGPRKTFEPPTVEIAYLRSEQNRPVLAHDGGGPGRIWLRGAEGGRECRLEFAQVVRNRGLEVAQDCIRTQRRWCSASAQPPAERAIGALVCPGLKNGLPHAARREDRAAEDQNAGPEQRPGRFIAAEQD